jgi:dTDP-4-amino-4,6-dideoxygalactose transaminase
MLRLDREAFGASRDAVVAALRAEGIPCSAGYGFPLHRQPLFRNKAFGPFLPNASAKLNYARTECPHSDLVCQQSLWLEHRLLLGTRADMDDILRAFEKIFQQASLLSRHDARRSKRT